MSEEWRIPEYLDGVEVGGQYPIKICRSDWTCPLCRKEGMMFAEVPAHDYSLGADWGSVPRPRQIWVSCLGCVFAANVGFMSLDIKLGIAAAEDAYKKSRST